LPLTAGSTRKVPLHLVLVEPLTAGPAARLAIELFQRHARQQLAPTQRL
jgi:hypothetical protein